MAMPTAHFRMPPALAAELVAFCDLWRQQPSTVIRCALKYVLDRPELLVSLLPYVDDARSPQQVQAWERDRQQLVQACDLPALLASMSARGAGV